MLNCFSHVRVFVTPWTSSPGSSVLGILLARILEGLPCLPPDIPNPGSKPVSLMSPALAGGFFTTSAAWEGRQAVQFSSVAQSCSRPHELQHARPPCPSWTPGVYSNSCQLSQWCHPTISSSVVPFSSCPQSLPASGSFPMSQFFASGCQSIGVSASVSVLPMSTQDWSPLGWTGWISLQSKGLSRVQHSSKASILWCSVFLTVPTLTSIHDHWKNHSLD